MKKKALRKEFYMEIKRSFSRFLSIFLIVALGVAFFSGVRAASPDMRLSADSFYKESRLMDIRVLSELGLTDEDVQEIKKIEHVGAVMPSYSMDVLCNTESSQLVVKLMSYPDILNQITVKEGRMPEKSGECLADTAFLQSTGYKIGDQVQVRSGTDTAIEDIVHTDSFIIVGTGVTSYYLSLDRGSSAIGSGDLDSFLVIPTEDFALEAYTEVYLEIEGTEALTSYTEEYDDYVDKIVDEIEAISGSRCEIRYETIVKEATEKIADGEIQIADAEQELSDAGQELADAKQELLDGEQEIQDGYDKIADAKQEIADNEQKIKDGEQELLDAQVELADAQTELTDGKAEIEENEKKLLDAREEVMRNKEKLKEGEQQLADAKVQLAAEEQKLLGGKEELARQETAVSQLQSTYTQLTSWQQVAECQQFFGGFAALLSASGMNAQTLSDSTGGTIPVAYFDDLLNTASILYTLPADLSDPMWTADLLTEFGTLYTFSGSYLNTAASTISAKKTELAAAEQQLAAAKTEMAAKETEISEGWDKIHQAEYDILDGEAKLADAKTEWEDGLKEYQDGLTEYADGEQELIDGRQKLLDGKQKLAEAEQELTDAEQKLNEGKQEYADGEKEYLEAKTDADAEISDAKADITDAKDRVNELEIPEWYVLDRNYIQTYVEYGQDSDRIGAIGTVFPVIFFLVAALVALTTMTRMVEEERTQIGTMKALGYSNIDIAAKYLLYALSASLFGSLAGLLVGQKVLPYVIIKAYAILYNNLPVVVTPLNVEYSVTATVTAIACTTLATLLACYRELIASPAVLMRPASPKSGKRVFLEFLPFLWKRLNFTQKSTIRNLARYKKRFFMTIFGIGGCTGLLLVGFGLKDSISSIGEYQFGEIRTYDADITIEETASEQEKEALLAELGTDDRIESFLLGRQLAIDVRANNDVQKSGYLVVPSDAARMSDFISFRNRETKQPYILNDDGVIITEKLARLLDVQAGDTIMLQEDDISGVEVKVLAITENYFLHYVYMSNSLYEQVYGEKPDYSEIFLNDRQNDAAFEKQFGEEYMGKDAVAGITFYSTMAERINNMLRSMDTIIYVLVVSAGLLAFVVLYNLNNININERKRELATLKVLGFYDQEVGSYVNRENIILTILGTVAGIFIGLALHRFVILTAEIDMMMFGRNIKPVSFLYSILLTFLFSIIINSIMYFRLKKINMVESLKSVE